MAAITKRLLHLRPSLHSYARPYPYSHYHFSSSSDRDDAPQSEQSQTHSSVSSSLNDVRARLQNGPPPPPDRRQPPRSPFSFPSGAPPQTPPPSRAGSTDEIRNRLAEFRSRSAPPPPSPFAEKYVSLHELYEKNIKSKGEGSDAPPGLCAGRGNHSFDSIRESLSKLESTGAANSGRKPGDSFSLSHFTKSLKMNTDPNGKFAAGSGGLISPFSGTAAKGRGDGRVGLRMEFGKIHDCSELGKRLQVMRPEKRKGKWFSLQELSNRLAKLREAELADADKRLGGYGVADSLWKIQKDSVSDQKARHRAQQVTVGVLGSMGAALDEKTVGPPKDHLFEKYFHPDNMSSAEKLKLELAKVRDEFKMSESDCGSARVQVAQLTTKIKHLSTALHKKDKHSRRGLLAMVQRRKKLLKYLRRTDWESYCLVLSKLGLRDNPDVKA